MAVDRKKVKNYKEFTIPTGWYGTKVMSVEAKVSKKGCKMGQMKIKIIDNAPIGGSVDPDKDAEPLNTWHDIWVVSPDKDAFDAGKITAKQYESFGVTYEKFVEACGFDQEDVLDDDDEVMWSEFKGAELEIRFKEELIDKEDPDKGTRVVPAYGAFRPLG